MNDIDWLLSAEVRVAYCTAGSAKGGYLAVAPLGSSQPAPAPLQQSPIWEARFSVPLVDEGLFFGDFFEIDQADESMHRLLSQCGPIRVPDGVVPVVLAALFPDMEVAASSESLPILGRFVGATALSKKLVAIAHITEEHRQSPVPASTLAQNLHGGTIDVDLLSSVLGAAGYTLAVVPTAQSLDESGGGPPWVLYDD